MTPTELNETISASILEQNKNKTAALRQIKQLVIAEEKDNGVIANENTVAKAAKRALETTREEADIRTKRLGPDDERAKMLYAQARYLEDIAPKEMDETELTPYVKAAIETCAATSMRDMRAIIAEVSRTAPSAFDNKMLSAIAKKLLLGKTR